jgi:DNA-binding protein H-NS
VSRFSSQATASPSLRTGTNRKKLARMDIANPNAWGSNWRCRVFCLEETMPKPNLSRMDVQALMDLRDQVDQRLREHRVELQNQLEEMNRAIGGERTARRGQRASVLKGRRVPPKYRSPSGDTWAGRGARPRWLVAAVKEGKKLDDFLIAKSVRKGRKKRRSKR